MTSGDIVIDLLAQLKSEGFTESQLKSAGFTESQLKDAEFTAAQLKNVDLTASQLKSVGKDAGFTESQLKDAEFTAAQLKNVDFTASQLKSSWSLVEWMGRGLWSFLLFPALLILGIGLLISTLQLPQQPGKCTNDACSVLVITDVQNDYCKGCGSESESPWARTEVKELLEDITKAIALKKSDGSPLWDLIVFTRDVLEENYVCADVDHDGQANDFKIIDEKRVCLGGSSLTSGSYGSQVPDELKSARDMANVPFIEHTKSTADWMTTMNPETSFDGKFKFDAELLESVPQLTLKEKLERKGFAPGKTTIVVTGIVTNRCVMKGAIHAAHEGYSTFALTDAIWGFPEMDNWTTQGKKANAPELDCPTNHDGTCTSEWKKQVYLGYKGGPTSDLAIEYMKKAGVGMLLVNDTQSALSSKSKAESSGMLLVNGTQSALSSKSKAESSIDLLRLKWQPGWRSA